MTYKESAISAMLCDSYYQQALSQSHTDEAKGLQAVSALLGQGLDVCPTHADMLSLRKWTEDYLKAVLDVSNGQLERAAEELSALEGLEPSSGDARVAPLLYQTYVQLAEKRRAEGNLPQAMEYYSQALTVPGVEHSEVDRERATLERQLAPAKPAPATTPPKAGTPEAPAATAASPTPVADPTPTLRSVSVIRYPAPVPVSPATDTVFTSGKFEKIVLTWSGPEKLAPGEYYDVSILHFFNSEQVYWGTDTTENHLELTPDIGYGKADKDVFHWFVTIRSTQRTTNDGKPDGPAISPKSEAFTFVWR